MYPSLSFEGHWGARMIAGWLVIETALCHCVPVSTISYSTSKVPKTAAAAHDGGIDLELLQMQSGSQISTQN